MYEIRTTEIFDKWLNKLQDSNAIFPWPDVSLKLKPMGISATTNNFLKTFGSYE